MFSYTTLAAGNSEFIRGVAVPLDGLLEEQFPSDEIPGNDHALKGTLALDCRPRSEPLVIAGVVGIILFTASRLAGKILDDVYSAKIQPRVKKALEQADLKLNGANASKKKVFQFGVWCEEYHVLILVAVVGDSFDNVLKQQHVISNLQADGIDWALENGRHKPSHVYRVENRQTNIVPFIFETPGEAQASIGTK